MGSNMGSKTRSAWSSKIVLALTLLAFLTTGKAPGIRELRNPDAEAGGIRVVAAVKRGSPV